jgi:predicted regulator of Ras-like GTPase activity (Roadblock/LC7/MglB family)
VAPVPAELGAFGLMSTNISATAMIQGFIGSCLVDSESGLLLASEGGEGMDMEAEAALNTMVVKAETEVIEVLALEDEIEDILITMSQQLHFIRPLEKAPGVFLYVALDKKAANLGMARMQVNRIERSLSM